MISLVQDLEHPWIREVRIVSSWPGPKNHVQNKSSKLKSIPTSRTHTHTPHTPHTGHTHVLPLVSLDPDLRPPPLSRWLALPFCGDRSAVCVAVKCDSSCDDPGNVLLHNGHWWFELLNVDLYKI